MKTNLLKFYLLAFFLFNDFFIIAQTDEPPDTTPTDEPPLEGPVGGIKLMFLAIAGISFAIYYFTNKKKEQLN